MDAGSDGFGGTVRQAYANQVDYCVANGATITARVVAALGALLDDPESGPFIARIRDWQGSALADGLPLHSAGALHALHLTGRNPALGPIYAGEPADDVSILREAVLREGEGLLPWLDGPPQTNEAGRSSNFMAAMLWLAGRGLPAHFDCLEIGSSAGINLMIDRYRYDLGGVVCGSDSAVMALKPEWRGPPPAAAPISFASLKGCDVAPVDLTDPAQAMRLRAYIWPEHKIRFARMDGAIGAANEKRPNLIAMRRRFRGAGTGTAAGGRLDPGADALDRLAIPAGGGKAPDNPRNGGRRRARDKGARSGLGCRRRGSQVAQARRDRALLAWRRSAQADRGRPCSRGMDRVVRELGFGHLRSPLKIAFGEDTEWRGCLRCACNDEVCVIGTMAPETG